MHQISYLCRCLVTFWCVKFFSSTYQDDHHQQRHFFVNEKITADSFWNERRKSCWFFFCWVGPIFLWDGREGRWKARGRRSGNNREWNQGDFLCFWGPGKLKIFSDTSTFMNYASALRNKCATSFELKASEVGLKFLRRDVNDKSRKSWPLSAVFIHFLRSLFANNLWLVWLLHLFHVPAKSS